MAKAGLLEVFRDLEVRGDSATLRKLGDRIAEVLPPDRWFRAIESESQWTGDATDLPLMFTRLEDAKAPAAGVFALGQNGVLTIPNIVPRKSGELGVSLYNAIFEEFVELGVRPAATSLGLEISTTDAWRSIDAWLTPEAARRLKAFSDCANKSSTAGHPKDLERFLRFVAQAHRDKCRLDGELLRRWLSEAEDWPEENAAELAAQYERGRELLEVYAAEGP